MPRSRAHAPALEASEAATQVTPPEPEAASPGTLAFALALGELAPDQTSSVPAAGVPLPPATRRRMEATVGGSLAGVRRPCACGLHVPSQRRTRRHPPSGRGPSAAVHNKVVKLVRASWTRDFTDEAEAYFNPDVHDDQVDAASGAHQKLAGARLSQAPHPHRHRRHRRCQACRV